MIEVKTLADSVGPSGKRITTQLWTYPRFIHSEIMTHRMLSRNSSSSRAIPTRALIQRVIDDPVIPMYIGKNQKGMQAGEDLSEAQRSAAIDAWLQARNNAVKSAHDLLDLGVHKQVVNRLIEPWMWITVVVTATEWNNFFALRDHEAAEPHFQDLARKVRAAQEASMPRPLAVGEWHLPFIDFDDEIDLSLSKEYLIKISVGRCARVSYLTHEGKRDPKEDIALHDRLIVQKPAHASPSEHQACALETAERVGNLVGWKSYRMGFVKGESVPG